MLIKYYIPSRQKDGARIEEGIRKYYLASVLDACIDINGGATEYTAKGYYRDNKGGLVVEKILIVETFGDVPTIDLVKYKELLNQETIGYSIDSKFYII